MQSNARHRRLIVPRHRSCTSAEQDENMSEAFTAPLTWMARLNRVFAIDVSTCPKCGGQLRVIGEITDPAISSQYSGCTAIRRFVFPILAADRGH